MSFDLSPTERELLHRILGSYLAELRQTIAATKRDTAGLHAEELMVKDLQHRFAPPQ